MLLWVFFVFVFSALTHDEVDDTIGIVIVSTILTAGIGFLIAGVWW